MTSSTSSPKNCPECNKTLRKVLISEDNGVFLCSSGDCPYPFNQPVEQCRTEISKEEIKQDIESRMNKAQVNKNVISLIKTL